MITETTLALGFDINSTMNNFNMYYFKFDELLNF
jgi:hypothetical protein